MGVITQIRLALDCVPRFFVRQTSYIVPRVSSFQLKMFSNLTLKGSWGHYYQFINAITNEDVLSGAKEFWLSSSENFLPGFAKHKLLGIF